VLFLFFSLSALQPSALFSAPLTIATYNIANYTLTGRIVEGIYMRGYPKTEKEKTALRAVIKALDADILALQEMGTQPFLNELLRDLKTEGVDYPHAQLIEAADTDRHVAVLSRRPFTTVRKHTDLTFKYFDATERVKRGLLEVHVKTGAGDLALFIVHLKSRLTDRKDDPESVQRRLAEAQAVRDRVLLVYPKPAGNPDARFMILGDFNDIRANPPLQRLVKQGRVEITQALRATDSRGEVWTHFYEKRDTYTRVDHILVSPALKKFVTGGVAHIYDGPGVREASDHRPVYVRLDLHP
jgi:endonuclease/exonuclease/phosphatase family metal-dependent hydrolase